jgi:hypothetical protein
LGWFLFVVNLSVLRLAYTTRNPLIWGKRADSWLPLARAAVMWPCHAGPGATPSAILT